MHESGESVEFIANAKDIPVEEVLDILDKQKSIRLIKSRSSEILGSKTETYQSEEQMLTLPTYTYESLSKSEKEIYESRIDQ
jgi:hypothetical protein